MFALVPTLLRPSVRPFVRSFVCWKKTFRGNVQASVERLDISGTGRVRPSDFMAAVRQVGIALSPVQQSNMMDLLERMGCASLGDEGSDTWVAAKAAVAAIALAGEKSSGGRMLYHDKVGGIAHVCCKQGSISASWFLATLFCRT